MDFKFTIYQYVLYSMYVELYNHLEKLNISKFRKKHHRNKIIEILTEIILIKEKYQIDYKEDLLMLEKYKI